LPEQQKPRSENLMRPKRPVPEHGPMDDEMVARFLEDGFVKIEGAFPPRVADSCARLLWKETGYDPDDPGTWKDPVHWVSSMAQGPFAAAANSPAPGLRSAGRRETLGAALRAGQLPAAVPAHGGAGRRGLAHRRQLPPRR
jgi:hypothetical protein